MIRFTPSSKAELAVGKVLLSEPFLSDAYFGRKAVLLCEHNDEGSFGFVLNNFVQVDLNELLDELPDWEAKCIVGVQNPETHIQSHLIFSTVPSSSLFSEIFAMSADLTFL